MDQFSKEDLKELMTPCEGQCISLYLPTHRTPPEAGQDPIRLKNQQREVEERLIKGGLRASEAKEFLMPLQKLQADLTFWQHQSDGLAIFRSRDTFHYYRLPIRFEELAIVARRFHVKPLIPLFSEDHGFFILALSQNEIRLLQGNRYGAWEMDLENVPKNLADALKYDNPERQTQFHTGTPAGMGKRAAMFHGHGVGIDDTKDNIHRYFLQIERGVQDALRMERAPMLLAGVDYLLSLYREINTYPHLLPEKIIGNPEILRPEDLHARAWKKVEPYFLKDREEAVSLYRQRAGTGKTSKELDEILASQGRIERLLVAKGVQVWGNFSPESGTVAVQGAPMNGNEDLLDLAAVLTILQGGMVYLLEPDAMPDNSPIAAIFRY